MLSNKGMQFLKSRAGTQLIIFSTLIPYKSPNMTNQMTSTMQSQASFRSLMTPARQMMSMRASPFMMMSQQPMRHFSAAQQQPLQIKIVKNPVTTDLAALEATLPHQEQAHPECFFPEVVKANTPANPTWKARKFNIDYSVYKLNAAATMIRKKHIYDATALIGNVAKKGGQLIASVLAAARVNGIKQGYAEERMFVKEVVLGKALGQKKMDIRARGKFGIIHSPISSITVILEEKSAADFYKLLVAGKAPPALGHMYRKMLYQNDADFERVKQLSHLTTSQGRYYRRTQFKRLVQLIQKDYQKKGVAIRKEKIERNLLEKAGAEYLEHRRTQQEKRLLTNRTSRQSHFEKNYKKK